MKMVSLQSGSNGNCIFVQSHGVRLLFDAGLTGKQTEERLSRIGVDVATIQGVIVSHDHADHVSGAGVLHRKFGLPVWMTRKTYEQATRKMRLGKMEHVSFFHAGDRLQFGRLGIETIPTTHDAADGVGFVVDNGSVRLGILTDLGEIFDDLSNAMKTLDAVLLESNYDMQMLLSGSYPDHLKRRIRGRGGHLSNVEAAHLIHGYGHRLRWACLAHLSQENNHPELAMETHQRIVGPKCELFLAPRYEPSEELEI